MSIIHLLLILSVNPTGANADNEGENNLVFLGHLQDFGIGGVHDTVPGKTKFLSKDDIEKQNQEIFENQLKELDESEEALQIKNVKRQWERELEMDEDSISSYDSEE